MSKQIEKKNLYHCRYCKKGLECKWFSNQQQDLPCDAFELVSLDIRGLTE